MLGIPIRLLHQSSQRGCVWCGVLQSALELPDLDPPAGQSLVGITLFGDDFADEDYLADRCSPLVMRLQTEFTLYAEAEIFTEPGIYHDNATPTMTKVAELADASQADHVKRRLCIRPVL